MENSNFKEEKLIAAIIKGDLKKVKKIIKPLKISNPWVSGYKYLCFATDYHQDEIITYLLSKNIPVNDPTNNFISLLHLAVKSNKICLVKKFLEKGAAIDDDTARRKNSFEFALEHNNLEILEILVDHVSARNISERSYMSLLSDLLEYGHIELVEKLLKKCQHFDIGAAASGFLWEAVEENYYTIVELLLKRNADVNSIYFSRNGTKIEVSSSCWIDDSRIVKLLLPYEASTDIEYDFYSNVSPKYIDSYIFYPTASEGYNKTFFKPYKTKYSALHLACAHHREQIVKLLVEKRADVNFRDHTGYKPVVAVLSDPKRASDFGEDYNIVEFLFKHPHLVLDFTNMHAILTLAIQRLDLSILELALLKFENLDASVKYRLRHYLMKDRSDHSLVHEATPFNQPSSNLLQIVEIWIRRGLNINIRDENGATLLHKAFWFNHQIAIELLLTSGAEYNVCDRGCTPLEYMLAIEDAEWEVDDVNFECLLIFLTDYFLKMKLLNICVNKKDYETLLPCISDIRDHSLYDREVEAMKAYRISDEDDDDVTLYDFVTADLNKMVALLKNKVIFETLESERYKSLFPHYHSVIQGRFNRGLIRKKLLDQIDRLTVFNLIKKLPYPCMRKIMDYFSNTDLIEVIYEYFD